MASFRQSSKLRLYPNGRHCCSSGAVCHEEAPIGSGARSSNQASFVSALPNGPTSFTSSTIDYSAIAIAHQPSEFSTFCLANWLTRIRRRLWAVIFGAVCCPRKLSWRIFICQYRELVFGPGIWRRLDGTFFEAFWQHRFYSTRGCFIFAWDRAPCV